MVDSVSRLAGKFESYTTEWLLITAGIVAVTEIGCIVLARRSCLGAPPTNLCVPALPMPFAASGSTPRRPFHCSYWAGCRSPTWSICGGSS